MAVGTCIYISICMNCCFPYTPSLLMEFGCFKHAGWFYGPQVTCGNIWNRYTHTHTHIYIYTYWTYLYIYIYIPTFLRIHIHTCIYIYTCMYIYTFSSKTFTLLELCVSSLRKGRANFLCRSKFNGWSPKIIHTYAYIYVQLHICMYMYI